MYVFHAVGIIFPGFTDLITVYPGGEGVKLLIQGNFLVPILELDMKGKYEKQSCRIRKI